MNKYKDLKKKSDSAFNEINNSLNDMNTISETSKKASMIAGNAHVIINDIDRQFSQATKLNNVDISFLFLATALQCVRQYLLTNFETRVSDKEAAKNTQGKTVEHSNRGNILYRPDINEIIVFCKTFLHNIAKKKYTPLRLKFFSDYFGLDRAFLSRKLSPVKLKMCA